MCETGEVKRARFQTLILILGVFFCLHVPAAHGQTADASQGAKPDPNISKADVPAHSAADESYRIGPQDVLQIDVWKEPEITRQIPVRPDGKISLPLLNDVQAEGLTAMQLAGSIRQGLTKYLTNPQVTVTVTQINSRRVFLTGEVTRPGALTLLPNMTVLQAVATGGFTQFAHQNNIYVLRVENGKQVKYPFHYKDVVKGKKAEENILLKPGDVIVVP
jgi:polysaccharide biosynthesis/export protein